MATLTLDCYVPGCTKKEELLLQLIYMIHVHNYAPYFNIILPIYLLFEQLQRNALSSLMGSFTQEL